MNGIRMKGPGPTRPTPTARLKPSRSGVGPTWPTRPTWPTWPTRPARLKPSRSGVRPTWPTW